MTRYPDDFDEDEIDEVQHQRGHRLGVEDVRFLTKRLGYRYVDWVHGLGLLNALKKYGEIPSSEKKLSRPRNELISMAMEYAGWLDLIEGMIASQNPHVWRNPGEMEGAPKGVPTILAELRMSIVQKLATGDLHAIGYIETSDEPGDWPLWVANYDDNMDFYRAHYDWEASRIDGQLLSVRIVENLGEVGLIPDLSTLPKRVRGRPSIREDIRGAFYSASRQGLIRADAPKSETYQILRPLAARNAANRGVQINPSDEALRKHTIDLFRSMKLPSGASRTKAKARPGV